MQKKTWTKERMYDRENENKTEQKNKYEDTKTFQKVS